MPPGGHYRDYYSGTLPFYSSHCSSWEDSVGKWNMPVPSQVVVIFLQSYFILKNTYITNYFKYSHSLGYMSIFVFNLVLWVQTCVFWVAPTQTVCTYLSRSLLTYLYMYFCMYSPCINRNMSNKLFWSWSWSAGLGTGIVFPVMGTWPQFYQTRSAWSMDQGSTKERSAVHNFVPTVTKFCVMWEGLSLPHDTKFGNCRGEIGDRRVIFIWSLIHGSSWSGLIKVGPGDKLHCTG